MNWLEMFQNKFGCPIKYITDQPGNYRANFMY